MKREHDVTLKKKLYKYLRMIKSYSYVKHIYVSHIRFDKILQNKTLPFFVIIDE